MYTVLDYCGVLATLQGIIESRSSLALPLKVMARALGRQSTPVVIHINGSSEPPLETKVSLIGEGPVISVSPSQLDWGLVQVLTPISKTITLTNESAIRAEFQTVLVRL